MNVFIWRERTSDQGTEGFLSIPQIGFSCFTLELPWRDNKRSMSCVPKGTYPAKIVQSPRFGRVYLVFEVPDRSAILKHAGNFAGNTDKGFKTHSHGCILLGKHRGKINGQVAILSSRLALYNMMKATAGKDLKTIIGGNV